MIGVMAGQSRADIDVGERGRKSHAVLGQVLHDTGMSIMHLAR